MRNNDRLRRPHLVLLNLRRRTTRENIGERFWPKVDVRAPDECWPWQKCVNTYGYGRVGMEGELYLAHRIAYTLTYGDPGALQVLHTCDNPPCCNPAHLFLGTHADNQHDKAVKGRSSAGERAANAKLTWSQAREIRQLARLGYSLRRLAALFGVSCSTIAGITSGKRWKENSCDSRD